MTQKQIQQALRIIRKKLDDLPPWESMARQRLLDRQHELRTRARPTESTEWWAFP